MQLINLNFLSKKKKQTNCFFLLFKKVRLVTFIDNQGNKVLKLSNWVVLYVVYKLKKFIESFQTVVIFNQNKFLVRFVFYILS